MSDNAPSKAAEPILARHIVGYIDLLGFSDAIANPTPEVQVAVLEMLQEFKAAEQNFEIAVKPAHEGDPTTIVSPSISTFSDHLVIAFNLEKWQADLGYTYRALMSIRSVANAVAQRARKINCLIRGGVAMGPLYHESGIVFGQGLVRAHELETRIAIRPRIVVDNEVLIGTVVGDGSEHTMFRDDIDGRYCLDYMTAYLDSISETLGTDSEESCAARTSWALVTRADARERAQQLRETDHAGAAGKWEWFAAQFERSMLSVNQRLFSLDATPITFPE